MTTRPGRTGGWTLIELMVAVALTLILVTSIAIIFGQAGGVVMTSDARARIHTNARVSLDRIGADLAGMSPMRGGGQRFTIADKTNGDGFAVDEIAFNTHVQVDGKLRPAMVYYKLMDDDAYWGAVSKAPSDPSRQVGAATGKPIYILVRMLLDSSKTKSGSTASDPPDKRYPQLLRDDGMNVVEIAPICQYVRSLNFEVLTDANTAFNASAKPVWPSDWVDPMGESPGARPSDANDPDASAGRPGVKLRAIRVILRIVEDRGERQERVFPRVFAIPAS